MTGKILTILFFVLSSALFSEAVNLNCEFYTTGREIFGPLKSPYQCKAVNTLNVAGHGSIDKVAGNHEANKVNKDVKLISIKNIKCKRFPKNFDKFFPDAEGIFAFSTGIETLVKDDLKAFSKLRYVDFGFNKINTLPSDTFEGNPNMEWIDFSDNRLEHIGVNLLVPMTKLNYADFSSNRCVDMKIQHKDKLHELDLKIKSIKCALNDA